MQDEKRLDLQADILQRKKRIAPFLQAVNDEKGILLWYATMNTTIVFSACETRL